MVRVPSHREPTHPGEMLLAEFLAPMGVSQRELADAVGPVSRSAFRGGGAGGNHTPGDIGLIEGSSSM